MTAPLDERHAAGPTTDDDAPNAGRIGRPPKLDEHGTPTRERLLQAAVDACIEFGYEGVTLSDIARRAHVSTPAVYSHFSGKAELLVEASQHELNKISTVRLPDGLGVLGVARQFLAPGFKRTRILVSELHNAANREPEVAALLADWQRDNGQRLREQAGFSIAQVKMYYVLLLGASHIDALGGLDVDQDDIEAEMNHLIEGWLGPR
jgi:AcrR family transcriptional regulator